ncbi:MAG TPA: 50S ribosomal protein L30 [Myxococcota bacterium]|jgi:large subunit ribosomal protein L30|nr:50S ribosomal protein L30 [Myxococcota bacterium]
MSTAKKTGAAKSAKTDDKLRVKLVRSGIGCPEPMKVTLRGLGLTRREKVVVLEDTPAVRGMIRKVLHLVKVEEI